MPKRSQLVAEIQAGQLANAAAIVRENMVRWGAPKVGTALCELAYGGPDSLGIAVYGLVSYMIRQDGESADLHEFAFAILVNSLCSVPGAYSLGLHHALQAVALQPSDVSRIELVLYFFEVPDRPLSNQDAERYARDALKLDPNNEVALEVLSKIRRA